MKNKEDLKGKPEKNPPAKDVDEYITLAPKEHQEVLKAIRKAIKEAAPEAEELISYRIPSYKYHGSLVHFAAFKNHSSFIVVNKNILEKFKEELKDFHTSGTTIRFTSKNPLPEALVNKIVKTRMKENEMRIKNK